jgi:hypothetical protein
MAAETGRDASMTSVYRVTRGWAGGGMRGDTGSPRRISMALVDTFTASARNNSQPHKLCEQP